MQKLTHIKIPAHELRNGDLMRVGVSTNYVLIAKAWAENGRVKATIYNGQAPTENPRVDLPSDVTVALTGRGLRPGTERQTTHRRSYQMPTQIKVGDTVRVTRQRKGHAPTTWEGVLVNVHPDGVDGGFSLLGRNVDTGAPEHSSFAGTPEIQRHGIAQTVTLLASSKR